MQKKRDGRDGAEFPRKPDSSNKLSGKKNVCFLIVIALGRNSSDVKPNLSLSPTTLSISLKRNRSDGKPNPSLNQHTPSRRLQDNHACWWHLTDSSCLPPPQNSTAHPAPSTAHRPDNPPKITHSTDANVGADVSPGDEPAAAAATGFGVGGTGVRASVAWAGDGVAGALVSSVAAGGT